ncbi:MAG: response regulator transcription factor [Akkermansiaceae bacterium]|nr:response regulator transcription factor [Akkermansiaceae bacterium]
MSSSKPNSENANSENARSEAGIRLLIIDDHLVVREGLEAMLATAPAIGRIATSGTALEALELCGSFAPDVVLLDVRMPGNDGYHVLDEIHCRWPEMRVLMFSSSATSAEVHLARQRGASGYLSKSMDRNTILAAIEKVSVGGTLFQSDATGSVEVNLSPRELDVLRHLGRGLGNEELGLALGVSAETIKSHLKSIFQKLGVSVRAEAVSRGYELGLLNAQP